MDDNRCGSCKYAYFESRDPDPERCFCIKAGYKEVSLHRYTPACDDWERDYSNHDVVLENKRLTTLSEARGEVIKLYADALEEAKKKIAMHEASNKRLRDEVARLQKESKEFLCQVILASSFGTSTKLEYNTCVSVNEV